MILKLAVVVMENLSLRQWMDTNMVDCQALKEDKVEIPAVHMAKKDADWRKRQRKNSQRSLWMGSSQAGILKKSEHLGHEPEKHLRIRKAIMYSGG